MLFVVLTRGRLLGPAPSGQPGITVHMTPTL
jgi:hypothetical protein